MSSDPVPEYIKRRIKRANIELSADQPEPTIWRFFEAAIQDPQPEWLRDTFERALADRKTAEREAVRRSLRLIQGGLS